MPGSASVTYLDDSQETANVQFPTVNLTAANFTAQTGLFTDLLAAYADISLGVINRRRQNIQIVGSGSLAASPLSQRETKWIIHYSDTQATFAGGVTNPYYGKSFAVEMGTADLTGTHLSANSDFANLTDADIAAFVTAFEAFARSPTGGTVEVSRIEQSGRRT